MGKICVDVYIKGIENKIVSSFEDEIHARVFSDRVREAGVKHNYDRSFIPRNEDIYINPLVMDDENNLFSVANILFVSKPYEY